MMNKCARSRTPRERSTPRKKNREGHFFFFSPVVFTFLCFSFLRGRGFTFDARARTPYVTLYVLVRFLLTEIPSQQRITHATKVAVCARFCHGFLPCVFRLPGPWLPEFERFWLVFVCFPHSLLLEPSNPRHWHAFHRLQVFWIMVFGDLFHFTFVVS